MSAKLLCSTLCKELLRAPHGRRCVALLSTLLGWLVCTGEGRGEDVKQTLQAGKAVQRACRLVSQPTSSPVTWCSMGCQAPVTCPACWKQVTVPSLPCSPGDVQRFLYHPVLWKVLSGFACPSSPVSWLLGITFPVLVELVGVVCLCLGSISAAA